MIKPALDLRCYFVTGQGPDVVERARQAAAGGAGMIQVRSKPISARELYSLSLAVAALSGGVSVLLALAYVWRVAACTPAHADPASGGAPGRILVLGMRLERDGRPGPLYRARLDRARRLLAAYPGADTAALDACVKDLLDP